MPVTYFMAVIALAGSAAIAQQAPPEPIQPAIVVDGKKQPAEEKAVCKMTTTGTMFRKRLCMSKSEWAKVENRSEDTLKTMREWQRVRCGFGSSC